jgi:cytoskeletal protein CcmA (bactofilin family)
MSAPLNTGSRNTLTTDVEIKGNLKFAGELTFAGKLEGEIQSEGALTLGDEAVVRGNMQLHSVVLRGKVSGNVSAREKIEIRSKGELLGDIRAPKLVIEEGATFVGKCEVNPNKATALPPPIVMAATKPPEPVVPAKK